MDPVDVMEWLEDDDEVIGGLQTTITLLIQRRKSKTKRGGSKFGRKEIDRNRLQGHLQLYNDYFSSNPTYPDEFFCRRFRMRHSLFLKLADAIVLEDTYFIQKRDAAGRLGFSPLQKATTAMRLLAYGYSGDCIDEYLRISKFLICTLSFFHV